MALGVLHSNTTTTSYAGKLTWKITDRTNARADRVRRSLATQCCAESVGEPGWPFEPGAADDVRAPSTSVRRTDLARLDSALTSSWTVDAAYAYNHNHFSEIPSLQCVPDHQHDADSICRPRVHRLTTGHRSVRALEEQHLQHRGQHLEDLCSCGASTPSTSATSTITPTSWMSRRARVRCSRFPDTNATGQSLTTLFSNIPSAGHRDS